MPKKIIGVDSAGIKSIVLDAPSHTITITDGQIIIKDLNDTTVASINKDGSATFNGKVRAATTDGTVNTDLVNVEYLNKVFASNLPLYAVQYFAVTEVAKYGGWYRFNGQTFAKNDKWNKVFQPLYDAGYKLVDAGSVWQLPAVPVDTVLSSIGAAVMPFSKYGSANKQLSVSEMPRHNHPTWQDPHNHATYVYDPGHWHYGWGEAYLGWPFGQSPDRGYMGSHSTDWDNFLYKSSVSATNISVGTYGSQPNIYNSEVGSSVPFSLYQPTFGAGYPFIYLGVE